MIGPRAGSGIQWLSSVSADDGARLEPKVDSKDTRKSDLAKRESMFQNGKSPTVNCRIPILVINGRILLNIKFFN